MAVDFANIESLSPEEAQRALADLLAAREKLAKQIEHDSMRRLVKEQIAKGNGYKNFLRKHWSTIEPGTPFMDNWHIDALSEHYEALAARQIKLLVVNIPPRFAKSTLMTVMPAPWTWTFAPSTRFIFATHSQKLARRDQVKARDIITSKRYQEEWGSVFSLTKDQNTKDQFNNSAQGYRIAMPVGTGTGEGADMFGIDDPIDASNASSSVIINDCIEWFDGTVSTRGNSTDSVIWLVMQRLSEKDLSGHILASELGAEHLLIPMTFEPADSKTTSIGFRDPRTREGELLWPARFGQKYVRTQKKTLRHRFSGQYQQRPVGAGGGMFLYEWLQHKIEWNPLLARLRWFRYWDLAYSKLERSSRSASLAGAMDSRGNTYIRRGWSDRLESPALKRHMRKVMLEEPEIRHGVEAKVHGMPTVQEFREEPALLKVSIVAVQIPKYEDKTIRAQAPADRAEEGKLFFVIETPADEEWYTDLCEELLVFPLGRHEDLVDCLSGVFMMIADGKPPPPSGAPVTGGARNFGAVIPGGRPGATGIENRLPEYVGTGKLPRTYG